MLRVVVSGLYPLALSSLSFLILAGCSFGPPNLAPILQDPGTGSSATEIFSLSYETAESYSEKHPYSENPDGDLMEFVSFKQSLAVAGNYGRLLFVPYFHDLIFNPGLGFGIKMDGYYGLMALDFLIVDKGEVGIYHPHPGGQAGVRLSPYVILTYEYYHLTYMDFKKSAYGWESSYSTESSASRISLALGKGFYVIPGLIYAHATRKLGWSMNVSFGVAGGAAKPPLPSPY